MKIPDRKTWLQCVLGLTISLYLLVSPAIRVKGLDDGADTYFNDAITKAGVAYATCRVMNGSISVLKESELQLEPAGIGLSIAIGQVLDPIDDMIERSSSVLVTAITSLGVQKLVYEISVSILPPIAGVFLIILSILVLFKDEKLKALQLRIFYILLLMLITRFCLPVSSLANEYLNDNFFEPKIDRSRKELVLGTEEMDKFVEFALPEIDGFKGTIENSTLLIKSKSREFKRAFDSLAFNAGSIVENLLHITFLYVGIFIVQVLILPLLVFWFMARAAASLFGGVRG
ncbi:MAG: hypothetical protein PF904_21620 [Kiritimatiellae bacterium]|jgi:hypothetical protein|nr:hypothetical protein [Kiritimatiellia bacterium]